MIYFRADLRLLQASILVELVFREKKKLLMIDDGYNILIMRKIKEKIFVKKQTKCYYE